MREDRRFCEKHPAEPLVACDLCVHEVRLETRRECAELAGKLEKYRESVLGRKDPLQGWLKERHTTGREDADAEDRDDP